MKRSLEDYKEPEIDRFIAAYEREGKAEGGVFTLRELRLEKLRRSPTPKAPRELFRFIVQESSSNGHGNVTYGEVWDYLFPGKPWQGNHSGTTVGRALGAVIAYSIRNQLPLVSTLVVRAGSRKLSSDAISAICNDARSYGLAVSGDEREFVRFEAARAQGLNLAELPAD